MRIIYVLLIIVLNCYFIQSQASIPKGYHVVYSQDFEASNSLKGFEMTDSSVWRISKGDIGKCLELYGQSKYIPQVRSPFNIALIKDVLVGDFILELRLNQNGKEYGHRDLCVMFGISNASNFYYTHIASKADAHANSIFIVNDEPRKSIATKRTDGTNWGSKKEWHTVRIVRKVKEGLIEVYFDDMATPIMRATDTHFKTGNLGFGSFDDTGKFDDIKIWAPSILKTKKALFH